MRHTNIVKLEPPYMIMFMDSEPDGHEVFKHYATLIESETDEDSDDKFRIVGEYPVIENGHVLMKPLDDCFEICREGGNITLGEFHDISMLISDVEDDDYPIFNLASFLHHYNINVILPDDGKVEGDTWEFEVGLYYWHENGVYGIGTDCGSFEFSKETYSLDELKKYIKERRDSYYEAFKEKNFRIVFYTRYEDCEDLINEINLSAADKTTYSKGKYENLPKVLSSDKAIRINDLLCDAGILTKNWQPARLSNADMSALADFLANELGINQKWKFFGSLWKKNSETLRAAYNKGLDQQKTWKFKNNLRTIIN